MADSDEEKVSIGAKVDPDLKIAIRTLAASQGKSMSQFVREAVTEKYNRDFEDTDLGLDEWENNQGKVELRTRAD